MHYIYAHGDVISALLAILGGIALALPPFWEGRENRRRDQIDQIAARVAGEGDSPVHIEALKQRFRDERLSTYGEHRALMATGILLLVAAGLVVAVFFLHKLH